MWKKIGLKNTHGKMRLLRLKYVPWFPFSTKWSHRDQIFSSHLEQLKSKTKYVDETMVSKTDQLRTKSLERWGQWGEPVTDQLAALRELPERLSHLGLQAPVLRGGLQGLGEVILPLRAPTVRTVLSAWEDNMDPGARWSTQNSS